MVEMFNHHHIEINAKHCIVFIIQAILWIFLFGAATIAARDQYVAAVPTSIASAAEAATTASTMTTSSLATVAQARAPEKGDMGSSPICSIYGIEPSCSPINHINIDRLKTNDDRQYLSSKLS